ncbi:glycosyltransferase [Amycolatopsis sp. NPDC049868]|uniref:glycosyltransferase n=1 Tax=Amycolatopsis sp. NPDC049868 TaxID=3363934 RepID=UPI0037BD13F3
MRILFAVSMQNSHFYPMVPLAWSMRADGHDVRVAHPPALTGPVVSSGLTSVQVGQNPVMTDEMRAKLHGRGDGDAAADPRHNMFQNLGFFRGVTELMAEDLEKVLHSWSPDLIVFDWQCYAAAILGRAGGVPTARFLFGPDFAGGVPGWREIEHRLLGDLLDRAGTDISALDGDQGIDVCPPLLQFDDARPSIPARYVPYNGAGAAERRDGADRRPRLAVTLGGTHSWVTGDLAPMQAVVTALDSVDLDIVVAVPGHSRELAPPASDRVTVKVDEPLALLIEDCDAILHHGGDGTVATSLVGGVPQIIAPSGFADFATVHSAGRVARCGAGVILDLEEGDAAIRATVEKVLADDGMRRSAAARAAVEQSRPGVVDAGRALVANIDG